MAPRITSGHRIRTGRTLPVLAVLLLAGPAGAQEKAVAPVFDAATAPVQGVREAARPMAGDSTDRIVREMEKKHGAKLMKNPKERVIKGRKVLVLTLFKDKKGRVIEVLVDAETGKEL